MKTILGLLASVLAFAGQGIKLSNVRVENGSITAQTTTQAIIAEFELSDITSPGNGALAELNAIGIEVDYSSGTNVRIAFLRDVGTGVCDIPIASFVNGYLYIRLMHDNAGSVGTAQTDYCEAWDITNVQQFSQAQVYTSFTGSNSAGIFLAQNGNSSTQRFHFFRFGTTLVPPHSRMPATADVGPLNSGSWFVHWKFDGSFADASGNGWTAVMDDSSTPSGTCGSTATSYCNTLYQNPIPVITLSQTTWRAGNPQTVSSSSSFTQADASSSISNQFWQFLSYPVAPPIVTGRTSTGATVNGLTAGDYILQLSVTDATPTTGVLAQHMGTVATDANDITINSSALPANSATDIILGPLQKWMSSVANWPLFDTLHGLQQSLRAQDFSTSSTNGGSVFQNGIAFFDYAQAGTVTATQNSYVLAGSGTAFLTSACGTTEPTAQAGAVASISAGIHTSDTYTVTGSNNVLKLAFDGGSPITVNLTTGSRNPAQIGADIQTAIGGAGVAAPTYNGFLVQIRTATTGGSGSLAIQSVANNAYSLLGFVIGTYTTANIAQNNMTIMPWSATPAPNTAFPTIRNQLNILGCNSDTSMVIEQANGLAWRYPTSSGVQYALDNQAWPTYNSFQNNGNYYDNALGDYYKAFKSGLAADLTQARARADRWFRQPAINLGDEYTTTIDPSGIGGTGRQVSSRLLGLSGVILRALDGQPSYWTGLEYVFGTDIAKLTQPGLTQIADLYTDQREFGYAMIRVAQCALFDPNSYANSCRQALVDVTNNAITNSRDTADGAFPYFPILYWTSNSWGSGSSVSVTNGSPNVTGTSTTFSNFGPTSTMWMFPTPGVRPANNAVGDSAFYIPVFKDATHLILGTGTPTTISASITAGIRTVTPASMAGITNGVSLISQNADGSNTELVTASSVTGSTFTATFASNKAGNSNLYLAANYSGTTGVAKGYAIFNSAADVPYVGWGCQPFMCGLEAEGFAIASLATACTSPGVPTNCSNTVSGLLSGYASDNANWIANVGYNPATQGVWQGAGFVNCSPPSANPYPCNSGNLPYGERVTAQEAAGGVSWAYRLSGTAGFKTLGDALFGAAWTNSGGLPDYNPPSGAYATVPGNLASPKYYGLQSGISTQPAYQAVRTCAAFPCLSPVQPANLKTYPISFSLSGISGAAKFRAILTAPNGAQVTITCTSSPCSLSGLDARQGDYLLQTQYLTSGNVVLASGDQVKFPVIP